MSVELEILNKSFFNKNIYNFLLLDNVALYTVTNEKTANKISRLTKDLILLHDDLKDKKNITITDTTSGVGGNSISFAKHFDNVNAVEINYNRSYLLNINLGLHKIDNVQVYHNNYLEIYDKINQDIIFIDPPWGGVKYKLKSSINLFLANKCIIELCNELNDKTKMIILKVPFNYNFNNFFKKIKYKKIFTYKFFRMYIVYIYC